MSMAFKAWTKEEEETLMHSIAKNRPIYTIAKDHNRSEKAIEMRIEMIIKRMFTEGKTINELSKMVQRSEEDIEKILNNASSVKLKKTLDQRLNDMETMLSKIMKRQKSLSEKLDLVIKKSTP